LGQGQQPGEGSDWAHSIYPEDDWEEDQEHWLILCADALAKPFTIEGLKESKTLKGHIDGNVKSVVSVTLLHELFHAAWHRQSESLSSGSFFSSSNMLIEPCFF
jgi:hypothetical protein